jgi:hypothetical protein
MRPCSRAPCAQRTASRAAAQARLPGSGRASAVQRKKATPAEQQREHQRCECLCAAAGGWVEALHGGQVESRGRPARRHIGRAPARRLEPGAQAVAPAAGAGAVAGQARIDLGVGPDRVPALQRLAGAVDARLLRVLGLESAEQVVPEHQDAAVVLVQVAVVHRVVHAVVGRRGEPAVEAAERSDLLGVDPELVEQVNQSDHGEHDRRHARQCHRQVEHPAQQRGAGGLAQRGREVVVLALVVHHVGGPEDAHFMAQAVVPVIEEVVEHQGQQPAGGRGPEGIALPQRGVVLHPDVDAQAQREREHIGDAAEHAQTDTAQRVGQRVGVAATPATHQVFDGDQRQEYRRGEHDHLVGRHGGFLRLRRCVRPAHRPAGAGCRPSRPGSGPRASRAGG